MRRINNLVLIIFNINKSYYFTNCYYFLLNLKTRDRRLLNLRVSFIQYFLRDLRKIRSTFIKLFSNSYIFKSDYIFVIKRLSKYNIIKDIILYLLF